MAHDQPGPAGRRGPLDDLRERLARLPDNHPSSPAYGMSPRRADGRPAAGSGPDSAGPDSAGPDGAGPDGEDQGGGSAAGRAGAGWAVRGRPAEADRGARLDQLRQVDRLARLLGPPRDGRDGPDRPWGDPGGAGGGAAPGLGALSGPRRRGAYQPWFADADLPWFSSADRG